MRGPKGAAMFELLARSIALQPAGDRQPRDPAGAIGSRLDDNPGFRIPLSRSPPP